MCGRAACAGISKINYEYQTWVLSKSGEVWGALQPLGCQPLAGCCARAHPAPHLAKVPQDCGGTSLHQLSPIPTSLTSKWSLDSPRANIAKSLPLATACQNQRQLLMIHFHQFCTSMHVCASILLQESQVCAQGGEREEIVSVNIGYSRST